MSAVVVDRLRDLFLTPDAAPTARERARRASSDAVQAAERAVPAMLGVLVAPGDALAAGAALGLAAAAARRAPCAVVCQWTDRAAAAPPRSGPAVGAARRLAQGLNARGLSAGACGRLVTVALPAAATEARAAAERTSAAAGDAPLVIVVAGARPPALDPLLASLDRLIVVPSADAPAGLEALAIDAASRLVRDRSTGILRLPTATATSRLLTATGLPLSPALRRAATAALCDTATLPSAGVVDAG